MILIGARLDTVVIAAIRNASAAAPFAAASKLNSAVQSLTLPVMNLMLPMVSELEARDQRQLIVDRMALATRVSLQVTLPVALAIAFFSSDIVDLWLGSGAPNVTAAIMTVLALQTLMICGVPSQKVLIGIGRARAVGLINTAEGILNLAISIILVSAYGAIGAAIGTLVSSYLIGPANFPLACRATGYPLGRFFGRTSGCPRSPPRCPARSRCSRSGWPSRPSPGRLLLGVFLGVGIALLVALLQLGPRRALSEVRSELRRAQPDAATSQLVAQDPA